MTRSWNAIKRFLTAEEVPRWFGLSIVLIYLVGLATVANVGIRQARRNALETFQTGSRYALTTLADRLARIDDTTASDADRIEAYQQALRDFARSVPARAVRVVAADRVVASTRAAGVHESEDVPLSAGGDEPMSLPRGSGNWSLRAPIRTSPSERSAGGRAPGRYVEAEFPPNPRATTDFSDHAGALATALVVLGALFVVYRCLREQLRGVHRIADRLQTHRDRMAEDLSALRIADTLDCATTAWNELVELAEDLREQARRTEANEELSRALQRSGGGALSEALNALPDGLMFITDETRIDYVNSSARRLFGWIGEKAAPPTLADAIAEGVGRNILALVQEARNKDGSYTSRSVAIDPDADRADDRSSYRVWVIPLRRTHRNGECLVVVRDISQQLRAERAREEFVSQVTHELRTPLTNIRAYAETLTSGMFDDPKVITECYNVITKETRRLSRLIEDILSVSQLEVGSIDLALDQTDLQVILTEGVRDVRGVADEKNIDIQLVLPPKIEPLHADRDKLAVVVNNLLGNAVKYTPKNGNIVVGCQFSGTEVILTFKDNGIGIDPADHARVFEKFQRGNDAEVRNETGTGIGLYTAREIVRRHGGDIELISEKGQGSTFMVRLPRQQTRATVVSTHEEAKKRG